MKSLICAMLLLIFAASAGAQSNDGFVSIEPRVAPDEFYVSPDWVPTNQIGSEALLPTDDGDLLELPFKENRKIEHLKEHAYRYYLSERFVFSDRHLHPFGHGPQLEFLLPLNETTNFNVWVAYLDGDAEQEQPNRTISIGVGFNFTF